MMKKFLFLLFSFASLTSFAQQSDTLYSYTNLGGKAVKKDKAVNVYKVYRKDSTSWIKTTSNHDLILLKKETFGDADLKVLNGSYLEYNEGKVSLRGFYLNGTKSGQWITYYPNGSAAESETFRLNKSDGPFISYWPNGKTMQEGNYSNGKMTGEWKQYTETGELKLTSNFNDDSTPSNQNQIKLLDITPPQYPGGMTKFYEYIGNNLRYPKDALEKHITGKVFFTVTIDTEGRLKDFNVISSPDDSLTQAAKNVVLSSPKWIPAKEAGKVVNMKQSLNINFAIN
ncbi:energy transducer TonB [Pedobacter aquatilis]|uniref:energy transducer TonB n=1 Tax=Pedobacter aquatilis TaxID=351343 RepID=UPI00292CF86A|nr:energy transducer TonB [Pedobacter aquatilis]